MNRSTAALLCASFACLLCAGPASAEEAAPAAPKPFLHWQDNSITLLPYGVGFAVDPEEQSTVTFEHAHDSKIGDLFLFVDGIRYHDAPRGSLDDTWYAEVSPRLSLGKTLDKDLSFSIFKDTLVAGTYERGNDPDLAEAVLLGVGFDLDVTDTAFRYAQLNVYGRSELTKYAKRGMRDVQITMVASRPLNVGRTRMFVDGYFDWVLGLGSEDWSYHLNPQVSVDLGNYWGKPDKLFAGVEIDLWWNKYQIPDSAAFDTDQAAVSLMVKYHL